MGAISAEVRFYWQAIEATLKERGLLRQRDAEGRLIVPSAEGLVFEERVVFLLDLFRLGGVSREDLLDEGLWLQWRAALQGRGARTVDSAGLAILINRTPGRGGRRNLASMIALDPMDLPRASYAVTLGRDAEGQVMLDVAGKHRAILVGGTTGGGKTNALRLILTQLAMKHGPEELKLAIVDTKQVDFSGAWAALPHLLEPVAHTLADAGGLIQRIEAERARRQALMAAEGVTDWRRLSTRLPLLLLVVDEAADLSRDAGAMEAAVDVARKGRAFGISVIMATQHPTVRVIDSQVKANLPTAIAFQTKSASDSRVILDRSGAEELDRPGLCLSFLGRQWREIQTLYVDPEHVADLLNVNAATAVSGPVLSDVERDLVAYALDELDGAFTIGKLYQQFKGRVSHNQLTKLGQKWEQRGWLTEPAHAADPRRVTPALEALAGVTHPSPAGGMA